MVLAFPLSPEEEKNILTKYSLICWKVVNRFAKQRKSSIFDKDDLYQECMLVLVRHMQRCKTREEMDRIQTMELVNVMTRYVLGSQAVWLDVNRTDKARQTLQGLKGSISLDAGDDVVPTSFDVDDRLDFERFLSSLSEKQRSIILARIRGENNKEIASRLGCTPQAVGDIVRRVRGHYQAYMKAA